MSYPKKKPVQTSNLSDTGSNAPKGMTDQRRDKLLTIQKREQLKSMLVKKFKNKYKLDDNKFLDQKIASFVKTEKLTEDNLKRLDQQIESYAKEIDNQDNVSVKSYRSNRSHVSNVSKTSSVKQKQHEIRDDVSIASSQYTLNSKQDSIYQVGEEDDEWAYINQFNTILHVTEQKERMKREMELKTKIKNELDKQVQEKKLKKEKEKIQEELYHKNQLQMMSQYDVKEDNKISNKKKKVEDEKIARDKQLKEEMTRKRRDQKLQKEYDSKTVQRLKEELAAESILHVEKKEQQKNYLQKVLLENEENKKIVADQREKERLADVKSQEEQARMLDQQEKDRAAALKAKEERMKKLMGRMADTVVKQQKDKNLEEEKRIRDAFLDREKKEIMDELNKQKKLQETRIENRAFLEAQCEEKKRRKELEKLERQEQAEMWRKDAENFGQKETIKKDKITNMNSKHEKQLLEQIQEKTNVNKKTQKMNPMEVRINNKLLKDIQKQIGDVKGVV